MHLTQAYTYTRCLLWLVLLEGVVHRAALCFSHGQGCCDINIAAACCGAKDCNHTVYLVLLSSIAANSDAMLLQAR